VICEEARPLVHAYVDGELGLAESLEVEAHLKGCVACAREQSNVLVLRAAFSNGTFYHEAPASLERRVRAAVRDARRAEYRYGRGFAIGYLGWAGSAAAAVLLIAIIVRGVLPLGPPMGDVTVREVVNDHLRSLTQDHLTDVLSSNQHTVKPWFDGRLNFTPPFKDLSAEGFPLVGGRLDYLDNRPVAAVVYRRRQHVINLFIFPAEHANDTLPTKQMRAGYNIIDWTESGMVYWAVSSLNAAELEKFAQLVREGSSAVSMPNR
jgi:anti-sigma factor RsiW